MQYAINAHRHIRATATKRHKLKLSLNALVQQYLDNIWKWKKRRRVCSDEKPLCVLETAEQGCAWERGGRGRLELSGRPAHHAESPNLNPWYDLQGGLGKSRKYGVKQTNNLTQQTASYVQEA